MSEVTNEMWGAGDDVDELTEDWDPNRPELPSTAVNDPDWIRRRLLALRFLDEEHARLDANFVAEYARLDARKAALMGPIETSRTTVTQQLTQYHKAMLAEDEANGITEKHRRTSIKMVHGTLRSGAGQIMVKVTDAAAATKWLRAHKMHDVLIEPETDWRVHGTKIKKRVSVDNDGHGSIVAKNGSECPGLEISRNARWFKQDT